MGNKLYLGIDQGTTGTTAILFDESWHLAGRGYQEITQFYPKAGWVEHDPEEIWKSVQSAVQLALEASGARAEQIRCIGIDHEGESVVVWDAHTGKPVYPAIVWQDRRTAAEVERLRPQYGALILEKTGLHLDPYFSATKLKWLLDKAIPDRSEVGSNQLLAGTMDTWLVWKLTHGRVHRTDASTASRTMLFNLHTGNWDEELLELFGVERRLLPEIGDSAAYVGDTDPDAFFGVCCPISGMMVDQQAALFGQSCTIPGMIKTTYGTGCFMLMNTGSTLILPNNGMLPTVAWQLNGQRSYALDGGIYIAGAAIQWLRDGLKIISSASETEKMAWQAGDNGGIYFVPAFTGLAVPYWDSYARGMIIGITGGTTREQIVRATLEATAYQVRDVLDAMSRDVKVPITVMRCDGGSTTNQFLMQFQSDILGLPLDVPEINDTTALGAAYMAALGIGDFTSPEEITGNWKLGRRYEPHMSTDHKENLLFGWHRAVERARNWIVK